MDPKDIGRPQGLDMPKIPSSGNNQPIIPGMTPGSASSPDPYPSLPTLPGHGIGRPENLPDPGQIPNRPPMPVVPGLNYFPEAQDGAEPKPKSSSGNSNQP